MPLYSRNGALDLAFSIFRGRMLEELRIAGAFELPAKRKRGVRKPRGPGLFDASDM